MSLFGFSYECDEGFTRFEETFRANSEEDVLNFILESIQNYLVELQEYEKQHGRRPPWSHKLKNEKGKKYFDMISRANWRRILNIPYDYNDGSDTVLENFMKYATVGHLTKIIDGSYVDGDSHFQITLYKIEVTVDLTN